MTAHGTPLTGPGSSTVFIGGLPAWRAVADFHTCPLVTPGGTPHGGGVAQPGSSSVLVEGLPAALMGDTIVEAGPPNSIVGGCTSVLIGP